MFVLPFLLRLRPISPLTPVVMGPAARSLLARLAGTTAALSYHARYEPGLSPRRLDILFQVAMRCPSDISGPRIGPGPAFVVGNASRLAGLVALTALDFEIPVIAAPAIDRSLDRSVARLNHPGAAHA